MKKGRDIRTLPLRPKSATASNDLIFKEGRGG